MATITDAGDESARSRFTLSLVLGLTLLGFAVRLYRLGFPELRGDEAFGLLFSAQGLGGILQQTLKLLEPHPPFDYALLHYWMGVAGSSEWAARFTSLFFGVLAVPLIFRLGSVLFSEELGLWAAAILALNPFQLLHAQEARMYAISTALGVASSLALLLAMRGNRRRNWVIYVILSVLSIYTHYYALFLLAAQGVYWLLVRPRGQWRAWLTSVAAIGLLYLPWLVVGWQVLTAYHGNGDSPAFLDMLRRTLSAFSLGQTISPDIANCVLPFFAAVFLLGLGWLVRQRPRSAGFLALYLSVPVLSVYLSSLSRPVFNERYLTTAAPPFYLLVAAGLVSLPRLLGNRMRALTYVTAAVVLAGGLYSMYGYFFDGQYTRNRGWRELATHLSQSTAPGDVIVQNYPDPTMWYYYQGSTPHEVVPATRPVSAQAAADTLTRLGNNYDRLWFVPYKSADWDANGMVGTWLDRHWRRVSETSAQSLALRQYVPPHVFLAQAKNVNVQWDDSLVLLGYQVEPSTGDKTFINGNQTLTVTLYWQTIKRLDVNYTIWVHLVATGNRTVNQADNQPVGGTYPTTAWTPGETIVDKHVLVVPYEAAPGSYSIMVGLYRTTAGDLVPLAPGTGGTFKDRYVLPQFVTVAPPATPTPIP